MLMWTPVPGAVKYNVYLNDKKVGEFPMPPAQLAAPTEAGDYLFQVTGVDAGGAEGPRSQPGKISIFVISPPKNVSVNVIGGSPAVRWDEVKGAAFYNVYRKTKDAASFSMVSSVQSNSYRDAEAKKGTPYFYAVTAKSTAGVETDPEKAKIQFTWPEESAAASETPWKGKSARLVKAFEPVDEKGKPALVTTTKMFLRPEGMYILDAVGGRAGLFDKAGKLIRYLGELGPLEGQLQKGGALGFVVTRDGKQLVILDGIQWKLVFYALDGTFDREIQLASPKDKPEEILVGKRASLVDLAQGKDGKFYVADVNKNRVLVFAEDGKYLTEFGEGGTESKKGPGTFAGVQGLVLDQQGNVYVCDFGNARVQAFSPEGKFLVFVGHKPGAGKLLRPVDMYFDQENVYAIDLGYNMIHAYAPVTGDYRFTFTDEKGDHKGALAQWPVSRPNQMAIDGKTLFIMQEDKRNVLQLEILD